MTRHTPPQLDGAYAECRRLTRAHGTTYFWATQLLPARSRPHVYALYGFCRHADDLVDSLDGRPAHVRAAALAQLGARLRTGLAGGPVDADVDPVVAAVVHTVAERGIAGDCFDRFLRSMTMDLSVASYDTWADLLDYTDGSAAVIGEMMLPILEPRHPAALRPARDLGHAFQLTNFLRDVGEDLDRNRVYVPQEDLDRFGADVHARVVTPAWRCLMRFEIERARELYRSADAGIALLPTWSARSIATARLLYARILDEIEANDYDVFTRRARVPLATKLRIAAQQRWARSSPGGDQDVCAAAALVGARDGG